MFDCDAAERVIDVLGGLQTVRVVADLADGPKRYSTLAHRTELDHKSLTRRLRRLEDAGIVTREVQPTRPLHVRYRLTSRAQSLLPLLKQLGDWWRDDSH